MLLSMTATNEILTTLDASLGDPRGLWSAKELATAPTLLDKLMNYMISYVAHPSVARRALRLFRGIDSTESIRFESWNEARVATLADLQTVLQHAGATCDTWELAITIKDFLQNIFDTIGYCDLDDTLSDKEVNWYLDQLQGKPNSWEKGAVSPYRPNHSTWNRKNARIPGEAVVSEPVLMFLKFLLNKTKYAPFDYHSEKVLDRLGLFVKDIGYQARRKTYNDFLGLEKPITKHRKLVEFSKVVCLQRQPRCNICPLKAHCAYFKEKSAS